jgi:geranylgeranyl pyrophosphate synthase
MSTASSSISARSNVELIPELARHLIDSGGKRLRPCCTLAAAKLCGYDGDGHVRLAASVEFMHTATLLHDDVVDESDLRAARLRRGCSGAMRRACWSAISCSARPSR